jgi:hypothetical protein
LYLRLMGRVGSCACPAKGGDGPTGAGDGPAIAELLLFE